MGEGGTVDGDVVDEAGRAEGHEVEDTDGRDAQQGEEDPCGDVVAVCCRVSRKRGGVCTQEAGGRGHGREGTEGDEGGEGESDGG